MEVYKGHLDTAGDLKLKQITKYKNIFITWVSLFPFKKWALWPGDPNYVKINKYILNCGPLIYNLWNFNFLKGISEIINFSMIFYFFLIFWKGSVFGIFCILIIMTYSNHNYLTYSCKVHQEEDMTTMSNFISPHLDKRAILVIWEETCNWEELVYAPWDGERDNGVKQFIFFDSSDHPLNVHSQMSNGLRPQNIHFQHLGPLGEEGKTMDSPRDKVIHQEALINDDGPVRC